MKSIFTTLLFLVGTIATFAATTIIDTIPGTLPKSNTRKIAGNWTLAGSPYIVKCNLLVADDSTLIIDPGVVIKTDSGKTITVNGTLKAIGTAAQRIKFSVQDSVRDGGNIQSTKGWYGLTFAGETITNNNDTSILKYCTVEHSKLTGIRVSTFNKLIVEQCIVRKNYSNNGGGFNIQKSSPKLINNKIIENYSDWGAGIFLYTANAIIVGNIISNNKGGNHGAGIYMAENSNCKIYNNIICNNSNTTNLSNYGGGGLSINSSNPDIINTTIANNTAAHGGGISVFGNSDPTIVNCILYGNVSNMAIGNQLYIDDYHSDPNFYYCDVQGGTGDFGIGTAGASFNGIYTGCIALLPVFDNPSVSAGSGTIGYTANWRIKDNTSPLINAGYNGSETTYQIPATDFYSTKRVQYGRIDIGAAEYSNSTITVSTDIITNTTWNADTVRITDTVSVADGVILTISPGVVVKFYGPYPLNIFGTLKANGLEKSRIVFTYYNAKPYAKLRLDDSYNAWKGIRFDNPTDGSMFNNAASSLTYCDIMYVKTNDFKQPDGALYVNNFHLLTVKNCRIMHNTGRFNAGVVLRYQADILFDNNEVSDNMTINLEEYYSKGGGIYVYNADPTISNNIIYNNSNVVYGAGLSANRSNGKYFGNKISNNSASIQGGGAHFDDCDLASIYNNVITNNNAAVGGGVFIDGNLKYFFNNTIAYNAGSGGAIYLNGDNISFNNNIVYSNTTPQIKLGSYTNTFNVYNCNIQGDTTQFSYTQSRSFYTIDYKNNINLLPYFKTTPKNVGTGFNGLLADFSLLSISPCINKGTNTIYGITMPSTDIAGNSRKEADTIDIGAYENKYAKLEITKQPTGGSICEGQAFTFSAKGSDSAFYQWQKDGTNINGAIYPTYKLAKATEDNSGSYSCNIYNAYGSLSTNSANLTVGISPQIKSAPRSAWIEANTPVKLNFVVNGSNIKYKWTKNTSNLPDTTNTFSILSFKPQNEGSYVCTISNTCGSVVSESIKLYIAPKLVNTNKSQLCEGDSFKLRVQFNDVANFQWYKDGNAIAEATDSVLKLKNITELNQGNYSCYIASSMVAASTEVALLQINKAPEIILQPSAEWVMLNSPLILESKANGTSPITYQWMKDGANVAGGGFNKLNIPVFTNTSQGNYICMVSNICGTAKTDTVKMLLAPVAKTLSKDFLCEGDTFRITTEFNGTANYQWVKDGVDITGATNKTLVMPGISETDMGNYYCRVSNSQQAMLTNAALLQIKSAPDVTLQPEGTLVAQGANPVLEVRAEGQKPLKYQWYKGDAAISGDTFPKLRITGFELSDEGNYFCKINSRCGSTNSDIAGLYMAPQICMVTVDTISGNNLVIWEKPSKLKYAKYNVYREGAAAGYYNILGSVLAKDAGKFEDKTVNPKEQAYLYKITGVDSLSNETDIELCNPHKTIHLLVTEGVPTGFQLDWDEYIGFSYPTYRIFRSADGKKFAKVHEMASTTRTWTDLNAPSTDLVYFVSVSKSGGCNTSAGTLKAGGGIYVQAVSNMEDNRLRSTSVNGKDININALEIYPNPIINKATIKYSVQENSKVAVYLCNSLGVEQKLLLSETKQMGNFSLDVDIHKLKLNAGVYYIKLKANNTVSVKKLVVTK